MLTAIRGLFVPEELLERVLANPNSTERNQMIRLSFIMAAIASLVPHLTALPLTLEVSGVTRALLWAVGDLAHNLIIVYVVINFAVPISAAVFQWLKITTPEGWAEDYNLILPYLMATGSLLMLVQIVPIIGVFAALVILIFLGMKWWKVMRETLGWNANMIVASFLSLLIVQGVIGAAINAIV